MLRYFKLKKIKDNHFRTIIISLIIACMLFYGYYSQHFIRSSMMSMGLFTLFHYRNVKMKKLVLQMFIIGFGLLLSFILGLLSVQNPFFAPFIVSLVAFFSRFLTRLYGLTRPGSLFFVMLAAMGASLELPLSMIPFASFFFFIGIISSILGAVLIKILDKRTEIVEEEETFKNRFYKHPLLILDSIFYSGALFITVYISHGLKMEKPYWMTVGCASILLAENLEAMRERHIQYILGVILGLSLASILLSIDFDPVILIIIISCFYGLTVFFVPRNYAIANIFINPMVLLLSSLVRVNHTITLIQYRFIGIFVGSLIGFIVAWLMNYGIDHYLKIIIDSDEIKYINKKII